MRAARENGMPSERQGAECTLERTPSALMVRMLFSALVDADLLDTERWDKGQGRAEHGESLEVLLQRLTSFCERKIEHSQATAQSAAQIELSRMRQQVYEAAVSAAVQPRGAFTFTVRTGGERR